MGFEIQASLISAGVNDPVGVTGNGVTADYDITVRIDLSAVYFHGRDFIGFECRDLNYQ